MKDITENELLQIIRTVSAQYPSDHARKLNCTFMAFCGPFAPYDPAKISALLIQLIKTKKVLSNIMQDGIEPVNAYLIPA